MTRWLRQGSERSVAETATASSDAAGAR